MKITYYCAMSSDGYIATSSGGVEWLDDLQMDEADSNYESFFASVDGLVMGRGTYDFIDDYGTWPYGDTLTWVVTSKPLKPLAGANIRVVDSVDTFVAEAGERALQHVWLVGGGKLASAFLDRNILTHLSITEMKLELGAGIPLFSEHELQRLEIEKLDSVEKQGYKQLEIQLASNSDRPCE